MLRLWKQSSDLSYQTFPKIEVINYDLYLPFRLYGLSSNGLGAVVPMICTVTETLNGEWELTLTHPIDDVGKWTRLSEGNILRAPVPAAMTPSVGLVTQQYQIKTYDVQIYKITTKSGPLYLRSGTGILYRSLGIFHERPTLEIAVRLTMAWRKVKQVQHFRRKLQREFSRQDISWGGC